MGTANRQLDDYDPTGEIRDALLHDWIAATIVADEHDEEDSRWTRGWRLAALLGLTVLSATLVRWWLFRGAHSSGGSQQWLFGMAYGWSVAICCATLATLGAYELRRATAQELRKARTFNLMAVWSGSSLSMSATFFGVLFGGPILTVLVDLLYWMLSRIFG